MGAKTTTSRYSVLSEAQAEHFLEEGYVVVDGCLDRTIAKEWTDRAWGRLGYAPGDPSTWQKDIVWMNRETIAPVKDVSRKTWSAICDVVGGEDRIDHQTMGIESKHFTTINSFEWSDAFIVNLRRGADAPWVPPSSGSGGWHKDGSYFRHFLDSREQSLLTVLLWSDVGSRGGGTFIAPDSIAVMARFLADHPEGVEPNGFGGLINQCKEFVEITGPVGTFALLHPFMLHASSNNHSGKPRFMTNPPVILKDHMNLNRPLTADFSLLERTTLRALGVDRMDFKPTMPRRSDWWEVR
jgi:hypothetical protein